MEETYRFGIINTNPDSSIYEFEEKPEHAKSTNASMGIYIFNWKVLKKYLMEDEQDPNSSNDFGKNILPNLLNDDQRLFAYNFSGYWKDVGTLESLWEANMDLINPMVPFDLRDEEFKIYARNYAKPPSFIASSADVENSMISEGCDINGDVENSIIFTGCTIEKGAVVKDSVVMPNAIIKSGALIQYAIIGEESVISKDSKVGDTPKNCPSTWGLSVVGTRKVIDEKQVIAPKEVV